MPYPQAEIPNSNPNPNLNPDPDPNHNRHTLSTGGVFAILMGETKWLLFRLDGVWGIRVIALATVSLRLRLGIGVASA